MLSGHAAAPHPRSMKNNAVVFGLARTFSEQVLRSIWPICAIEPDASEYLSMTVLENQGFYSKSWRPLDDDQQSQNRKKTSALSWGLHPSWPAAVCFRCDIAMI